MMEASTVVVVVVEHLHLSVVMIASRGETERVNLFLVSVQIFVVVPSAVIGSIGFL